jgi:predicted  nucleic acid-binding Zn-ribbon protein
MIRELEQLMALQRLDTTVRDAERRIADEPERARGLERRLEEARQSLAAARERLGENQQARRAIEKDVAVHQGRLSKFREQAMAVKTNQEYHAIQHEIAFAQGEVKKLEDRVLELMVEGDDLGQAAKRAETTLAEEQKAVESERRALAAELAELRQTLARLSAERAALVAAIDPRTLGVFDLVSRRRNGVALAEAREGICTICHVRLRPQLFNTVRRNDQIVQCESCSRILYFVPQPSAAADPASRSAS